MIIVSKFSTAFSGLFIILTIFLVTLSHKFYENQTKISDFIAIKVFLLLERLPWCLLKLSYVLFGNRSFIYCLYILAASNRLSLKSNEAGLKYFLMGSLRQELYFWYLLDIRSFDVIEISELSQSAELPICFQ
jgi:NADH-quinone oxidoreductase subunit N